MILVIQRVKQSSVKIKDEIAGRIGTGLLVLIGIEGTDGNEDLDWLVKKLINLRIFPDDNKILNKSAMDLGAEILIISQFTLCASTKKGNRPSFLRAAPPEISKPLYQEFINKVRMESGLKVETGVFGADMEVSLVNDGPVTLILDTKNKI